MDIIKRLQLNKNPKDIKSGSVIGAKNIMLDPISSSITNEYGFSETYKTDNEIKGVIPLNEGICIFSSNKVGEGNIDLHIKPNIHKSLSGYWKWEGGDEVIGTFAYNYKGELILAVSELTNDNNKSIPLKIINFDKHQCLNLEAPIPFFSPSYTIGQEGFLVCGVYTFFIRFKLDENTYTKWFQLTDDIIIIDALEKERPVHYFDINNEHSYGYANTDDFKDLYINNNLKSDKNINLNINFSYDPTTAYTECQIGYVIKRDSEILGRILGEYNINYNENLQINFDDNKFTEEIEISEFLEEPHQFYNVKNVVNYNNRLYISNYFEYKKYSEADLSALLGSVRPKFKHISILDNNETYRYEIVVNGGQNYVPYYSDTEVRQFDNQHTIELFKNSLFYREVVDEINKVANRLKYYYPITPLDYKRYYTLQTANLYILYRNQNTLIAAIPLLSFNITNYNVAEPTWLTTFHIETRNTDYYLIDNNTNLEINLSNAEWGLNCLTEVDGQGNQYSRSSKDIRKDDLGIRPNVSNTYYSFKVTSTKVVKDFRKIGVNYNNNRTLIPGQLYNFYIHFVRKDLSSTDGYKIDHVDNSECDLYTNIKESWTHFPSKVIDNKNYYIAPFVKNLSDKNKAVLTVPRFSVNEVELRAKGFVGFFVSYEKIETTVINVVPLKKELNEKDGLDYIHYTNTELIYNSTSFNGKFLETSTSIDNVDDSRKNNKVKNKINSNCIYNTKTIDIALTKDVSIDTTERQEVSYRHSLYNDENVYKSKVKTLYQLTPITFIKNVDGILSTNEDTAYMYLPGFFNNEKIITYDKNLIISAAQTRVYDDKGNSQNEYKVFTYTYGNYSQVPLNAFSIKQDYEKATVVINNKVYSNSVIAPSKLQDFLEIKPAYTAVPLKSFTNYQNSTIDNFNKTIYRSDVISDESLNNGFRHFSIENYKNIIENKGNIVNIVGFGLYMLVHTEYSLFVFDRNNQLSDKAQLQIPDTFDIDYKELTPSGEGFGGLKYKDECILTKEGYIWFDRITKSIFIFNGQQIIPLSADIHNILKNLFESNKEYTIRFAEDYLTNRLLVTVKDQNNKYITFSYSFDNKCFISLHDYTFDKNYKTYNNSFLFTKKDTYRLFEYNKTVTNYEKLTKGTPLTEQIFYDEKLCSYVDIIFNDKYELPKTLNSISYIISRNNDFNFNTNIIDQYFNTDFDNEKHQNKEKLYSGFKLFICTDLTFSGELDISQDEEVNKLNDKKPQWNNGIWNFNWFRENIKKDVTNAELEQQNVNKQMKEVYQEHDDLYQSGLEKSDMRSIINGKYFIFRFVFERNEVDLNLKFETLDVNISKL